MLKVRTVGFIKTLFEEGKKHKDINRILISQGLIKKPLTHKTLRNIKNGVTHSEVKSFTQYVKSAQQAAKPWESFLGKVLNSYPEIADEFQIISPDSLVLLQKYVDMYDLPDSDPRTQVLKWAKEEGLFTENEEDE